jgi:hypothetical protein
MWSKLKHHPAYTIGSATREGETKRMYGSTHGACHGHSLRVADTLSPEPIVCNYASGTVTVSAQA